VAAYSFKTHRQSPDLEVVTRAGRRERGVSICLQGLQNLFVLYSKVLKSLVSTWKNRGQVSKHMCVLLVLNYLHLPKKPAAVRLSLVHFATSNKKLEKASFAVSFLHTLPLLLLLLLLLLLSHSTPIFMRRQKITSQFRGKSAPSRDRAGQSEAFITVETLNS